MKKPDFVKNLLTASELEESHISAIAEFFVDDFDWRGMDPDRVGRMKELLQTILSQTQEHEAALNEILKRVEDSHEAEF